MPGTSDWLHCKRDSPNKSHSVMSVRHHETKSVMTNAQLASMADMPDVQNMHMVDMGEGATGFNNISQNNPLSRKVVVTMRASLADLITKSAAATWAPSAQQLSTVFKQKKFVSLNGRSEMLGDLKSVVIHKMDASSVRSTFPVSVGASITGVDESYFSSTGRSFSMIALSNAVSQQNVPLQEDDVSVAYDFAQRYPGFTADNLETNGIHMVPARKFVLVALNHPLVTAIQENQQRLQMSDIQQMPDQLLKISTGLYNTLMPLVKEQVRAQIKVADFSSMSVSIHPADYNSWNEVSDLLTQEKIAPIKAEHRRSLGRVDHDGPDKVAEVNAYYQEQIEAAMNDVANTAMEFSMELAVQYNFLHSEETKEMD